MKKEALRRITSTLGDKVSQNEPMSLHTSFRIGGPADLYAVAKSAQELVELVSLAREHDVPYLIIGRGTNILVADKGIRGLVVENRARDRRFEKGEVDRGHCLKRSQPVESGHRLNWSQTESPTKLGDARFQENAILRAESRALLSDLASESARWGLGGLEWAVDIPGSVGGAIVGNAGAYGGYVGDVTRKASVLLADGAVHELSAEELSFGYRTSRFKEQREEVILSAEFALHPEPVEVLEQKMVEYSHRREARQPTEPSAGSVFKCTEKYPAGFLIEQAGLKGVRIGGAQISPKHANFIVNLGGAKASDVKALIDLAREAVLEKFGETLELEIQLVGEW